LPEHGAIFSEKPGYERKASQKIAFKAVLSSFKMWFGDGGKSL
jgi:hypothetical protein